MANSAAPIIQTILGRKSDQIFFTRLPQLTRFLNDASQLLEVCRAVVLARRNLPLKRGTVFCFVPDDGRGLREGRLRFGQEVGLIEIGQVIGHLIDAHVVGGLVHCKAPDLSRP